MQSILATENKAFIATLPGLVRMRVRSAAFCRVLRRGYMRTMKSMLGALVFCIASCKAFDHAPSVAASFAWGDGWLALGAGFACYFAAFFAVASLVAGILGFMAIFSTLDHIEERVQALRDGFSELAFSGPEDRARFERKLIAPCAPKPDPSSRSDSRRL